MRSPSAPTVAIAIPCFNEERRLDAAVLTEFVGGLPDASLLLVDDGSTDATWELIQRVAQAAPRQIEGLRLAHNRGKAEAVRLGMLKLLGQGHGIVGFWDADLATPLSAVPQFLDILNARARVEWVIGSRVRLLGRHIERRATRHYLGRVFATLASMALDLPVYDTQCGAKLFRATPGLRRVLATPFKSRWVFDVEMIWRLSLLDGADQRDPHEVVYELPLSEWRDVKGSKVRAGDFACAAIDLLRIRLGTHDVAT